MFMVLGDRHMPIQNTPAAEEKGDDASLRPVTPKEAAAILDCNLKSIYDAIKRGEIPVIKIGRLRFIPRPAFLRMLRDGQIGGGKAA
jgi:excisionase family DNA binding protein